MQETIDTPKMSKADKAERHLWALRWNKQHGAHAVELSRNGALSTRLDRDWPATNVSFYDSGGLSSSMANYRTRAVELDATNAIATGIVNRCVENVVGTGIHLRPNTADEGWNEAAQDMIGEWSWSRADVRGLGDYFTDLQPLWFRERLMGGDVGVVLLADGSLQTIDGADIETPPGKAAEDSIVDGVQVDRLGRAVAFWVAADENGVKYERVNARDFVFFPNPLRPKAVRGVTALRQAIDSNLFDMMDGYLEAVVAAAQMAAMFGLLFETEEGAGALGNLQSTTDAAGDAAKEFPLEPGMIRYLRTGERVVQVKPEQPTQSSPDFMAMVCRYLGLPFGLPLELVLMDFSRTNYSSARASLLQAYRVFRMHQGRMVNTVLRRIHRWRMSKWVKAGELPARDDAWRHTVTLPVWAWVDPEKEMKAHLLALDSNLTTLSDIAAGMGRDFLEMVQTRQRERATMEAAGIPLIHSNATRDEGSDAEAEAVAPGDPTDEE
jgi:lambda family phage portal protein